MKNLMEALGFVFGLLLHALKHLAHGLLALPGELLLAIQPEPKMPEDDPGPKPERKGLIRWVLSTETLPLEEPPAQQAKQGLFRWLFAGEKLPEDEPPDRPARPRIGLRWLFSGESLEPAPDATEASDDRE